MGIDDALEKVMEHKWIAAGAVLIGVFLVTRGGGGGGGGNAADYSASLQSMAIASDTNVKLAEINAGRAVGLAQAAAAVKMGTIDYAKTDRMAGMSTAIATIDANTNLAQNSSMMAVTALQNILGYRAASKELENERARLNSMESLGFADINMNRELGAAEISTAREIRLTELNNEFHLIPVLQASNEKIALGEQATVRDLAWRQKQIAKIGANASMFGQIISGGFETFNNAMAMFGGGR